MRANIERRGLSEFLSERRAQGSHASATTTLAQTAFEEASPDREWEIGISTAIAGEQQVDA
jgi:hypothetical protein